MPEAKWAAFRQGGEGATEGAGINTLIGVGSLEPLGAAFPPLGALEATLEAPAIGETSVREAIIARTNADVDVIGATAQFLQSEGADTASGDEIPVDSAHFNVSGDELPEDHYILGVTQVEPEEELSRA